MGIFKEIPPTAGLPLRIENFFRALFPRRSDPTLEELLKEYIGIPYIAIASSGTVSLYVLLEALKYSSSKRTVVIPAFVCPLVALSIARAGFKVEVCDIQAKNFDFDYLQLEKICSENRDIFAVIAVHLGGIPIDFETLNRIVSKHNIFIIEDCAQALGARYRSRKVGTLSNFSFFSFARGKGLTMYEGGALATSNRAYVAQLDEQVHALLKPDSFTELLRKVELFGYYLFYNPWLFWHVWRAPQNFWNFFNKPLKALAEDFDINFPIHSVYGFRKRCVASAFYELEDHIRFQRMKAQAYINGLSDIKGISLVLEHPRDTATYPYVIVIFDDKDRRNDALKSLSKAGLGASVINGLPINEYHYLRDIVPQHGYLNAKTLANHHITLSTNIFLTQEDIKRAVSIIKKALA